MKNLLRAIAVFPILVLADSTADKEFDWLIGCWWTPDKSSQEVWVADSDHSLAGFAVNVRDDAVSYYEILTIRQREDGSFVFTAHPAREPTAAFKATEITETGVVFTNPDHDYPQKISYFIENDELVATISMLNGDRLHSFRKATCE